jgi:hypothetical protein
VTFVLNPNKNLNDLDLCYLSRVDQAATNTGATFRILLTAFTHASIDNLIDKVLGLDSNLIAKSTETQAPLPIARLINEGAANTTKFGRATEPELDSKKRRQRPVFPDINPQIVYTTAPKEVNTFLVANPQVRAVYCPAQHTLTFAVVLVRYRRNDLGYQKVFLEKQIAFV